MAKARNDAKKAVAEKKKAGATPCGNDASALIDSVLGYIQQPLLVSITHNGYLSASHLPPIQLALDSFTLRWIQKRNDSATLGEYISKSWGSGFQRRVFSSSAKCRRA